MNKCKWGNLADPNVYVDRESNRNCMMPKQNFARLGHKLALEGKFDSAVRVCDYVQKIFPDNKIHFDIYMYQFVEVYYMSNAFEKGNKLANRLLDIHEQNINYISSLDPEFKSNFDEDMKQAYSLLSVLKQLGQQYNQADVVKKIDKYLKSAGVN